MTYGIYQVTAGAVARRRQVDIVANNVANADTPGYRSQEVTFETVLRDARAPERHMVMTSGTHLDTEPGAPVRTDRLHDFALKRPGYVRARTPNGQPVLLRTASLSRNEDGLLVDRQGNVLLERRGLPIRVGEGVPIELGEDGAVLQSGLRVGQLWFQSVADEGGLESRGGGTYAPTEASGQPFDTGNEVMPGFVEDSNVRPLENMVKLIELERGFQASMKVVQAYREADEQLIEKTSR